MADDQTPSRHDDGATHPDKGASASPAGSEPTGSTHPPAESVQVPADSKEAPAESARASADSTADSTQAPADPPADSTPAAVEPSQTQDDSTPVPAESAQSSAEPTQLSAESAQVPAESSPAPAEPTPASAESTAQVPAGSCGQAESQSASASPWARPENRPAGGGEPVAGSPGPAAQPGGPAAPSQPYPAYPAYPGSGTPANPRAAPPHPASGQPPFAQGSGQSPANGGPSAPPDGGFQLFNQPTEQYQWPGADHTGTSQAEPGDGQRRPRWSTRRKLVVGGVALALVVGLIGGGLGGMIGYQVAATGGHLNVLDGPLPSIGSSTAPESAVEDVANDVLPSVVQIRVTAGQQSGAGSGMVISPNGLILTNNHVVDLAADGAGRISVLFQDGRVSVGKIVGRDSGSDIAVVQAQNINGLKPIDLGNSDAVKVGQSVIAIGSPLGLGGTVTTGIVSALNRAVEVASDGPDTPSPKSPDLPPGMPDLPGIPKLPGGPSPLDPNLGVAPSDPGNEVLNAIQTDAAINPGNSGGPLVDVDGKVVGINTAIASFGSSDQSGSVGLGFSIPINQARRIAQQLEATGHATKATLGVEVLSGSRLAPVDNDIGAKVSRVVAGSPADKAGLKPQDLITKVDGRPITYGDDLVAAMRAETPGATVELTLSDGRTVKVVLGEGPSSGK